MNVFYLPAYWPSALDNRWSHRPLNAMDPRLRGTDAHHPYALASYGDPNWRNVAWEPDEFVFGDSGGYSAATRGLDFDPRDVIRWQVRCCTVGALLDEPPWRDWTLRRDCLACTVANTRAALPIYRQGRQAGSRFRWWGVVHGRTTTELAQWWRAISRVYPFTDDGEGWAFKPLPQNDPEAMVRVLGFIKETGIRRAHFFATSGFNAVETLYAYGPDAGLEFATFDSTSPLLRGSRRVLIIPTEYGYEDVKERFRDTGGMDTRARDYMLRVCQCQSCGLLRDDVREDGALRTDESYLYHRIMFHNVIATRTCYDTLRRRYQGPGLVEPSAPTSNQAATEVASPRNLPA